MWVWANVRSLVDIAIVSFIIYRILVLLTGTRAIQLVKGVLMLALLSALATLLGFRLLTWFLGTTLWALSFAIPIVFQPELRKMLEELGRGKFHLFQRQMSVDEAEVRVKQITGALTYLKNHKIGALLVFQKDTDLGEYWHTAIHLNSNITQELLISIFWKNNPLHDGAVIIDKNSILAAGCILPVADAPEISRWYGTRHRAGLGVSMVSDAIVLIVSEERGEISLAVKGKLTKDFQLDKLLMHYFAGKSQVQGVKAFTNVLKDLLWAEPEVTSSTSNEAGGLVK